MTCSVSLEKSKRHEDVADEVSVSSYNECFHQRRQHPWVSVSLGHEFVDPIFWNDVKPMLMNACHLCRTVVVGCGCKKKFPRKMTSSGVVKFKCPPEKRAAFAQCYQGVRVLEYEKDSDWLCLLPQDQLKFLLTGHAFSLGVEGLRTVNLAGITKLRFPRAEGKYAEGRNPDHHDKFAMGVFEQLQNMRDAASVKAPEGGRRGRV
jgi:hypothetical protein